MARILMGLAICALLGAGVAGSGVGRLLPLDAVVPPPVPEAWAVLPTEGRIQLTLAPSQDLVSGLAAGLSRSEVALHRGGAVALVDGRVFAIGAVPARELLRALAWDDLPMEVRQAGPGSLDRFHAPRPAPLAWRTQRDAFLALDRAHELVAAYPSLAVTTLGCAVVFLLHTLLTRKPRRRATRRRWWPQRGVDLTPSAWRIRRAQKPVRVVLVPDRTTLAHVRAAIGEENVVAGNDHAFAFADGWVLAVRKGSVFELVSELGWRMRPLEMATRAELIGEGHALSPVGDDGGDTLELLEALHVCGPLAHGTG
jgi:hypothetical protein